MKQPPDPIGFLKNLLSEVEKDGKKSVGNRIYTTWSNHYSHWDDFTVILLKKISNFDKFDSMVIFRWMELQNTLLWIWMNVIYGRYHTAIRELRYALESFIQAYYLDVEHPEAKIDCKLEILKEIEKEASGGRLIDKTDLGHKQEIKALYSELSKYVHSSYKELEPAIIRGKFMERVTFRFNRELFDKCEELTDCVMDFIYFTLVKRFFVVGEAIKRDKMMLDSLKESNCEMTLSLLKKSKKSRKNGGEEP